MKKAHTCMFLLPLIKSTIEFKEHEMKLEKANAMGRGKRDKFKCLFISWCVRTLLCRMNGYKRLIHKWEFFQNTTTVK
jgi:hypothetical protein